MCEDKLLENCNHSKTRNEKLKMIMKGQLPVIFWGCGWLRPNVNRSSWISYNNCEINHQVYIVKGHIVSEAIYKKNVYYLWVKVIQNFSFLSRKTWCSITCEIFAALSRPLRDANFLSRVDILFRSRAREISRCRQVIKVAINVEHLSLHYLQIFELRGEFQRT